MDDSTTMCERRQKDVWSFLHPDKKKKKKFRAAGFWRSVGRQKSAIPAWFDSQHGNRLTEWSDDPKRLKKTSLHLHAYIYPKEKKGI